jgi:transcriptional regulator GlxA family with amidase domain
MKPNRRVIFYINKGVHLLDLAGAVQSFYEAGKYGKPYDIWFVADEPGPVSSAGLPFAQLAHYSTVEVRPDDLLIVAGLDLHQLAQLAAARKRRLWDWLTRAAQAKASVCSICTGAFLLAEAGVLKGKTCTTHWRCTDRLQKGYPGLTVLTNRLYVKDGNIYTSAGGATGLDLALYLLEERHGPEFAYKIAREMVVYIRRDGSDSQDSIYLQYRSHVNQHIHIIQDWMIHHLQEKIRIEELAALIYTSPRNLTRLFKATTGVTVGQYLEKLRVEKAVHLLQQRVKIGTIPRQCGLQSTNQLRSILKKHTGRLPSELV